MLYPLSTITREVIDLSGLWTFSMGELKTKIAVPGSFNDQLAFSEYKNYVGDFCYSKDFVVNEQMLNKRIFVRFGSATHNAKVFVNGTEVGTHKGGFTPFEIEIGNYVKLGENSLVVEIDNILDYTTLPVGVYTEENGVKKVDENFDFFNYAGLHRKVYICAKPQTFLEDVAITYDFSGNDANVNFKLEIDGEYSSVEIEVLDRENKVVAKVEGKENNLSCLVKGVKRWQPLKAYLYNAKIRIIKDNKLVDEYIERFGMRSIEVKNGKFLINGEPFYFKGYGRHEDTYLNGRGLNEVANIVDMNLMKWQGANSFRTSHYPYSEEMMKLADEEGFVVIDETTAVGLFVDFGFTLFDSPKRKNTWQEMKTHEAHEQVIRELIKRDKNHACVVMWSIANEPDSAGIGADEYFKPLFDLARELDPQKRPCTLVNIGNAKAGECIASQFSDVICINRYYGWYYNMSDFPAAKKALKDEIEKWHELFPDKPIMFTEYGADTVAGFHDIDFNTPYTEEYQIGYYEANHEVIDELDYFIGEHVWNFSDFQTKYGLFRVQGNKKGLFTRERKPKAVAHYFRKRWNEIPNFNYKK